MQINFNNSQKGIIPNFKIAEMQFQSLIFRQRSNLRLV